MGGATCPPVVTGNDLNVSVQNMILSSFKGKNYVSTSAGYATAADLDKVVLDIESFTTFAPVAQNRLDEATPPTMTTQVDVQMKNLSEKSVLGKLTQRSYGKTAVPACPGPSSWGGGGKAAASAEGWLCALDNDGKSTSMCTNSAPNTILTGSMYVEALSVREFFPAMVNGVCTKSSLPAPAGCTECSVKPSADTCVVSCTCDGKTPHIDFNDCSFPDVTLSYTGGTLSC
jgi:hypothetical protein